MGTSRPAPPSASLAAGPDVQTPLLELLRCPVCRASLAGDGDALSCAGCGREFGVEDGIPLMLHADLPGAHEKLAEAAGWVEKARAEEWYEPDDAVDAALPFLNEELGWDDLVWASNSHSIRVLLDRVGARRGLRVLEVGAAKAWASRFWLERGCEFVATDILTDPKIGLGRGAFYGDFARVQADGEHLPFADASFDVVYCVATLHHALDLGQMVRELARVARPGAVVAGLNEGTRGVLRSPENPEQEAEKALGINEHVHTVWAYAAAFVRSGLAIRRLERADGAPPSPYGRVLSKLPGPGLTLGTIAHLSAYPYAGVSIYAERRERV
jgi:SAM-dependent methyltransferase